MIKSALKAATIFSSASALTTFGADVDLLTPGSTVLPGSADVSFSQSTPSTTPASSPALSSLQMELRRQREIRARFEAMEAVREPVERAAQLEQENAEDWREVKPDLVSLIHTLRPTVNQNWPSIRLEDIQKGCQPRISGWGDVDKLSVGELKTKLQELWQRLEREYRGSANLDSNIEAVLNRRAGFEILRKRRFSETEKVQALIRDVEALVALMKPKLPHGLPPNRPVRFMAPRGGC